MRSPYYHMIFKVAPRNKWIILLVIHEIKLFTLYFCSRSLIYLSRLSKNDLHWTRQNYNFVKNSYRSSVNGIPHYVTPCWLRHEQCCTQSWNVCTKSCGGLWLSCYTMYHNSYFLSCSDIKTFAYINFYVKTYRSI